MAKQVGLVTQEVSDMFARMEPRHIALLVAKILHPDTPLIELSKELWPDLGYPRRKEIMAEAQVTKVVAMIRQKPWIMAAIMAGKLAPVAVATLFELSQSADKDNVRATAAKELVRLAQSTAHQVAVVDDETLATEELDRELANAESVEETEFLLGPGDDEDSIDPEELVNT